MNLLNPGVERVIFYNSDSHELSGHDLSPQSTLTPSKQTRTRPGGGYLPFLTEFTIELQLSDVSFFESVQGGKWIVFIEKHNGAYVFGETEIYIGEEDVLFDPESEEYPFLLKAKHISESPGIGQDGNLLGTFEDTTGNGIADGWDKAGGEVNTFLNGVQTTDEEFMRIIPFAIPGKSYTFSVNATDLYTLADNEIDILFFNGASQVGSNSTAINATGIHSVTLTAPATADSVRVRYTIENQTGVGSASFSNPKLKLTW